VLSTGGVNAISRCVFPLFCTPTKRRAFSPCEPVTFSTVTSFGASLFLTQMSAISRNMRSLPVPGLEWDNVQEVLNSLGLGSKGALGESQALAQLIRRDMGPLRLVEQEVDAANRVDDRAGPNAQITTEKRRGPLPGQLGDQLEAEFAVFCVKMCSAELAGQLDDFLSLGAHRRGNPEMVTVFRSSHGAPRPQSCKYTWAEQSKASSGVPTNMPEGRKDGSYFSSLYLKKANSQRSALPR